MRRKLTLAFSALLFVALLAPAIDPASAVSQPKPQPKPQPTSQPNTVAKSCRVQNWLWQWYDANGWHCDGSCSFAAYETALKVCGYGDQAARIDRRRGGPAGLSDLEAASGPVPYVECAEESHTAGWRKRVADFVGRCCDDGRGCVLGLWGGAPCVPYMARYDQYGHPLGGHAVYVFHFDGERCGICDSNQDRGAIRWVTCEQLLEAAQGWAIAPAFKR